MDKRILSAVLVVVLGAIGVFVYTSPAPPITDVAHDAAASVSKKVVSDAAAVVPFVKSGSSGRSKANGKGNGSRKGGDGPRRDRVVTVTKTRDRVTTKYATRTVTKTIPAAGSGIDEATSTSSGNGLPVISVSCDSFRWQQDAQAAYVANLTDPWGLDGDPGPANDDGIACSLLPTDPARPPSQPALPSPPPPPTPPPPPPPVTAPPKDALVNPSLGYFGVSTPQAPFDWKEFQIFTSAARKTPNMLEFFSGWDRDFPGGRIVETWKRGILPMLSWEPRPTVQPMGPDSDNTLDPGYTLKSIYDGTHDDYIDRFATAVRELNLPVAIRFAHEMNGNWFPWSEERNGNSRGEYVLAWRHVVDRFRELGANNVIWIWSPNVVTGRPSVRLAPLYPGDDYVDWVGMVGYYRRLYYDDKGQLKPATFENTYQSTLDELSMFTAKPVVITEAGATEVGGKKVEWINGFFSGLKTHPNVIGFVWFDQSISGNDWRIESSRAATEAFATGVADPMWGAGK